MTLQYIETFEQRGALYHGAMQHFPRARAAEFDALFAACPLRGGERLLDIPSGGGYLARHLGNRASVSSLEITPGFGDDIATVDPSELSEYSGFDRATCLAALHHFDDPMGYLDMLRRTLSTGGILHVADVCNGSPLCDFLDGFVGKHNITGHEGRYLSASRSQYTHLGTVVRCDEVHCPWRFATIDTMLMFCSGLFGLADCAPESLLAALHELVGIRVSADQVLLDWRLLYIDIVVE